MSARIFLFAAISAALFVSPSWAREGRGEHITKVKCDVADLSEAKTCFALLGENMPSENDANGVLVTADSKSKALLIEILQGQKKIADISAVKKADYLGVVVQNDDEASVYYYVLMNGAKVKPRLVGNVISVVDFNFYVCPLEEGGTTAIDKKFAKVKNLLLGMNTRETVAGKIWLDDISCE